MKKCQIIWDSLIVKDQHVQETWWLFDSHDLSYILDLKCSKIAPRQDISCRTIFRGQHLPHHPWNEYEGDRPKINIEHKQCYSKINPFDLKVKQVRNLSPLISLLLNITRQHGFILTRHQGRVLPTSLPDLSKPTSILKSVVRPKLLEAKMFRPICFCSRWLACWRKQILRVASCKDAREILWGSVVFLVYIRQTSPERTTFEERRYLTSMYESYTESGFVKIVHYGV